MLKSLHLDMEFWPAGTLRQVAKLTRLTRLQSLRWAAAGAKASGNALRLPQLLELRLAGFQVWRQKELCRF